MNSAIGSEITSWLGRRSFASLDAKNQTMSTYDPASPRLAVPVVASAHDWCNLFDHKQHVGNQTSTVHGRKTAIIERGYNLYYPYLHLTELRTDRQTDREANNQINQQMCIYTHTHVQAHP